MDCRVNSQYRASDSSLPLLRLPFAFDLWPFDDWSIGLWPLDIWPLFEVGPIFNWSLDMVVILRLAEEVLGEQGDSSRLLLIFLTTISLWQILEILFENLGNPP